MNTPHKTFICILTFFYLECKLLNFASHMHQPGCGWWPSEHYYCNTNMKCNISVFTVMLKVSLQLTALMGQFAIQYSYTLVCFLVWMSIIDQKPWAHSCPSLNHVHRYAQAQHANICPPPHTHTRARARASPNAHFSWILISNQIITEYLIFSLYRWIT